MDKRIIHTVFESKAQQFPGNIAVEDADMQLTYQELDQQANGLASCLRELGVGRDRVVMTLLGADVKLIVSLLGILKAGGIYLPTDMNFPARLMAQVFEEANPDVIITTEALLAETRALVEFHQSGVSTLLVLKADLSFYPIRLKATSFTLQPDVQAEDACYIIYTSGSTGKAKAILGNHKGLSHFIHWEMGEFGLDEHTVVSQLSQFTFDASLRDIFVPLASGGKLCLPQAGLRNNIPMLIDWLQEKKVSLVHCVPAIFKLITRYLETAERKGKAALLPDLRFILMAGEPLYARDISSWREIMGEQVELVNLYGTSETTMAKTFHRIGTVPSDPGTALHVGKAISNTAIAVFNGNKLCSPGEIGEIYIKTPFRTKGYYNNEALTNSVFVQNPLVTDRADIMHKTGDMGRYFADGTLEVHGRLDDQVKVNGIRVELGEIKQAVLRAPGIADVAVIVLKNGQEENELVCYYVSPDDKEGELRLHLANELSASLIPAHFVRLDELPLTVNGKVDKKVLPKPMFIIAEDTSGEAETDPVILSMQRIWQEVLLLPYVSRNTSFFQAGGTSLKAIMVISRLYTSYHVQLKIKDVFEHPTLISLCDFVKELQQKAFESIGLVPRNDNYETTYAQKGIWLHLQYGRGLSAYNMTGAYDFKGNFNIEAFKKTLYLLVDRYEILRTTFEMDKGELRQRVHDFETALVKLQLEDYSDHPSPGKAAAEAASAGSLKVFDPLKEPLIRFHLIRQQETHHTLVISQHHLIADGWSISILLREFLEVFTAFCRDEDPQLSALNIQYKDYAAWHNRYINSASSHPHKAFWKEQLDGDLQPLNLSGNTYRGIGKTYEGNLYSFDLPSDLTQSVFDMSKAREKSTFAILLTLTNILLYGYTGHEDIILGAPFAGRTHPDLESQLGLFVSIIMLRNHLRADQNFSTLLTEVARNATAAYEHGIYPLEKILEELELTNNGKGLQFLNVFVQMQEMHEDLLTKNQGSIQDLSVTALDFKHLTSKFDLTFNFVSSPETGRISVVIEYNTAMFTENKMIKLQDDFVRLLSLVAANENISLTELILHLPAEPNVEISEISGKISEGISNEY